MWTGPSAAIGCIAFELKTAIVFTPWLRRRRLYAKVYLLLFEKLAELSAAPGDNSAVSLTKFEF